MAEDVTEQRRLEEQLRQSQKLEAIGRLAGGVAHDFNNMLTAIGGYTALALDQAPAGSALEGDLDEIRKATDRAALLDAPQAARLQPQAGAGPRAAQPERRRARARVDVRPLIGEDVALTTELRRRARPIEADPGQLHQVVMNLVVNARDAMPGGGSIAIVTANSEVGEIEDGIEPGRYVTLTVRDIGPGIDEATMRRSSSPSSPTKDAGKGTGLGLATVYGIVKQSGGYVAVDSEVGVGSAFTIYLRRAEGAHEPEAAPSSLRSPPSSRCRRAPETRVLVVDEAVIRGLADQVLRGEGYEVVLAADGDEAIALARETRIDVLLTDLTMLRVGGHELADRRCVRRRRAWKVMFMSGFAEGGDFSTASLPPATAFLEKPFTVSMLNERMRALVELTPTGLFT